MSETTVIHGPWKPRVVPIHGDAQVERILFGQGGPENFEPPESPAGLAGARAADVQKGMAAAREDDAHAQGIVRTIIGFMDPKEARDHELRALSAQIEAFGFYVSELARKAYALKENQASRHLFDAVDLIERACAKVYPHDPEHSA